MNKHPYTYKKEGWTGQEIKDKYDAIAKHSPSAAFHWVKKNFDLTRGSVRK